MKEKKNISALSDESLMILVREKETYAFNELYSRYGERILNFLYRFLYGDEETAQDLLQDTFVKVIDKADSFDVTKRFSTWLYTIAANLGKNELRRKVIRNGKLKEYSVENEMVYENTVDKVLDRQQLIDHIYREIARLRPASRELIILRFQEEMSINDIALIMGVPEGTVKSRLHHLLKKLSKKLKSNNVLDQ